MCKRKFIEKLNYFNEISLKERIKQLINDCDKIDQMIFNTDKFSTDAVNTRNYHAHLTDGLKRKSCTGINLVNLLTDTKLLLEYFLIKELGLSSSITEVIIDIAVCFLIWYPL